MKSIICGTRNAGIIIAASTFLAISGPQAVFAGEDVDNAVTEFEEAQEEAVEKVPQNQSSKNLEDKLDAAARKLDDAELKLEWAKERQEDLENDGDSSQKDKDVAEDAVVDAERAVEKTRTKRDEAMEAADEFKGGAMHPEEAKAYRSSLEKRREKRKKLKKEEHRLGKASIRTDTAKDEWKKVRNALKKADKAPPRESAGPASALGTTSEVPDFRLYLDGGYVMQDLPMNNAHLGVIRVGVGETPLISVQKVITGGSIEGGGSFGNIAIGPKSSLQFNLRANYAHAEGGDNAENVEPRLDITNGITYWDRHLGHVGVSSQGAGAWGDSDTTFQSIKVDMSAKFGNPCALGDDDDLAFGLPGFEEPRFYLEFGPSFRYSSIETEQSVRLFNPSAAFAHFDIGSDTDLELHDYQYGAIIGAYYTLPIPKLTNFAFSVGVETFLGYHDSDADADQRNRCHVEFAVDPGVNACNPDIRDFELDFDLSKSGFDYGFGGMARFDYRMTQFLDGRMSVGFVYDVDYSGMSRLDAPTNLEEDGPLNLEWKHVLTHKFSGQISYRF